MINFKLFLYHQKPLIGIKGRLQTSSYENEDNKKIYVTEVVAEKVTFLSSNKNKEEKKEEEKPKKTKKQ